MSIAYIPPGVNVQEFSSPSVSPLLAVPASICLVGLAAGTITNTEAIVLSGTSPVTLTGLSSDATMTSGSIVSVVDALNPSLTASAGYVANTDYTFAASPHTIARIGGGSIADNSTVYVTYTYAPADYFSAIRLTSMQDIEARFGAQYNSTGTTINSPLSYAAAIAFENGASSVVLQPLFTVSGSTRVLPNDTQAASSATWATTFAALRDLEDINVITPVVGQSQTSVGDANQLAIIEALQDHIYFMQSQEFHIVGISGEDSSASSSVAQKATLISHGTTLEARYAGTINEAMVLVAPSKFSRQLPSSNATIFVGGQYVAAAIAGVLAAQSVSAALTRHALAGFVAVNDPRTKAEKNTDAQNGLCVIEQKGLNVLIRHGITMDTSSVARRELSVVRAKYRMITSVRDTCESLIGQVVADDNAPLVVASAVIGVLENLRSVGDIVDYSDVQARTASLDPTIIEVRFSYRPAFPVNYITIQFSLDLTSGAITLPGTTQVTNSA